MANSTRFTREELYEMVWKEPISQIAKRLGSSDVAIAKICRKMDIPRPPRGYWARVEHGYPVEKKALPKAKRDTITEWELVPQGPRERWSQVEDERPAVVLPEPSTRAHRELIALGKELRSSRKDDYGRVGKSSGCVHVSPAMVSRTISLLTALFKAVEARGHTVRKHEKALRLSVDDEHIEISVFEPTTRVPHPKPSKWGYPKWDYVSTGRLTLTLSAPGFYKIRRQWSDTARTSLGEKLGDIVLAIEHAPTVIAAERRADELRRRQWERECLVRRRNDDVLKLTHERAKAVNQLAKNLEKARQIRAFVDAIESDDRAPVSSKRLARWASQYADHLDPLLEFRITLLDTELKRSYY